MPSRRNSKADRERRRDEAEHRADNRASRTPREQFDMLNRAPGVAAREMRRLKVVVASNATVSHMPDPPHVTA